MLISITYEYTTANGWKRQKTICTASLDEANKKCNEIENAGYKIVDVTREE